MRGRRARAHTSCPRFASARIIGAPIEPKYKTRTGLLLFWMRRNVDCRTAAQRKIVSNETVLKKFLLNLFSV
jgi:hypothetical protein